MSQKSSLLDVSNKTADRASLAASLLIGVVFLASGSGKLLAPHEAPGQVIDFISAVAPQFLLTPWVLHFLYNILVPYVLPSAELVLGIMLLIGAAPRLAATLTIPLALAFASTNIWAIMRGNYPTCASCFGIWENIFGHLTPVQSLIIDITLLLLALAVILLHPGAFLSSRKRLSMAASRGKLWLHALRLNLRQYGVRGTVPIYLAALYTASGKAWKAITRDWRVATAVITGFFAIAGLASYFAVLSLLPRVTSVNISEISDSSALVSITLNQPRTVMLTLYDNRDNQIGVWSASIPAAQHRIVFDELLPATEYHFEITIEGTRRNSAVYHFVTTPPKEPPFISQITVLNVTDTSATITWVTTHPTSTEIAYWLAGSSEQKWLVGNDLTTEHKVTLTELSPEGTYYFRIRATDAYGKSAVAEKDGVFSLAVASEVTKRAPGFVLPTLDGYTVTLSQFKGKVVVLNFWSMWCSACRKELPLIQEVVNKPVPELVVLNIHLGGREDTIRNYLESQGLNLTVLLDKDGSVQNLYGVVQTPTVFILDRAGIIRFKNPRFTSAAELINIIQKTLNSPALIGATPLPGQ